MIKPGKLSHGDKIVTVSLSNGMAGESAFKYRYEYGKSRLQEIFKLKVVEASNSLRGINYLYQHPEKRAEDFMNAFTDKTVNGIVSNIGGDDTIRLLPYIDFDIIKNNPKVFLGYSDSTINHFMMYYAGVISYYGPCVMCEFAENNKMHEYTKKYVEEFLFKRGNKIIIKSSDKWTSEFIDWINPDTINIVRKMKKERHGFEVIQGSGKVSGILLGGCIDVFPMMFGTKIWPTPEGWKDKILLIETSESYIDPYLLKYYLRSLVAQGVIDVIKAIIIGKPKDEKYYDEYKNIYKQVISDEAQRKDLPIMYNINIGHADPMSILPIGDEIVVDFDNKKIIYDNLD